MGLFDVFMSKEAKIRRHHRRTVNRDAAEEDRDASMRWLAQEGSPQALLALLSRFDLHLDHQLKDAGEKDLVESMVIAHGAAAVEPVRSWLRTCKGIARPLKVLAAVAGDQAAFDMAFELLEKELDGDPFKPEKKKKLLLWLAEHRHPRAIEAVGPFLRDFDEGVRYAAAEVLITQETDEARPGLEAVLLNPDEDSTRLRSRVADVFVARRWPVAEGVAAVLPEAYAVRGGRVVAA